jgi:ubiquitin C-terminal hydrolase
MDTPIFGFINNGNICYFNSLLQSLINCKEVIYYIVNQQLPKNELQLFFKNKFTNFIKLYNLQNIEQFKKETSTFSIELLSLLLQKYKHCHINEQQSSSEFFLYLIEELGIDFFFKIKHEINIHCGNCKNIVSKTDECFHYEMFEMNSTEININDFMYSQNIISDYKCEKCKVISKSIYEKKAINISRYFVILLNKYFNKTNINFPNSFKLNVKENEKMNIDKYVWENIGVIEHSGHLYSGHYTAICKRFNQIFVCNDMNIKLYENKEESEQQLTINSSKDTYMIFYEKQ